MHKGVILLVKADNSDSARIEVETFLEPYHDQVYDWYRIGGRWNNALAPKDLSKKFEDWVHNKYKNIFRNGMYLIKDLENEETKNIIQNKWEKLGLKGKNPYYDSYAFNLTEEDGAYNIVALEDCLEIVQDWVQDVDGKIKEVWDRMISEKNQEDSDKEQDPSINNTMIAYYARIYSDLKYRDFSFECEVFDIETRMSEKIPKDTSGYYAVVIDMHN